MVGLFTDRLFKGADQEVHLMKDLIRVVQVIAFMLMVNLHQTKPTAVTDICGIF